MSKYGDVDAIDSCYRCGIDVLSLHSDALLWNLWAESKLLMLLLNVGPIRGGASCTGARLIGPHNQPFPPTTEVREDNREQLTKFKGDRDLTGKL